MAKDEHDEAPASQKQESTQSAQQGEPKKQGGESVTREQQSRSGIGSSQAQDRGTRPEREGGRPSAGTPDIERGGPQDVERSGESLVKDPTGAFKERP